MKCMQRRPNRTVPRPTPETIVPPSAAVVFGKGSRQNVMSISILPCRHPAVPSVTFTSAIPELC